MDYKPNTLAYHLRTLGIRPVPLAVLEAHKAEQLRLNPPHVMATIKPYAATFLVSTFGYLAQAKFLCQANLDVVTIVMMTVAGLITTLLAWVIITMAFSRYGWEMLGRAQWVDSAINIQGRSWSTPRPILTVALRLKECCPNVKFVQGDLIQNDISLDPYLIAELDGERICLGIWDGFKIVASADMD
jgi:hypothetical protein